MVHLWGNKNAYRVLVGKSEGHRWENTEMDSKEIA